MATQVVPQARKTLQETIQDIETQIHRLEQVQLKDGLTPKQEQDLIKLKELLNKAHVEQERVKAERRAQEQKQTKGGSERSPSMMLGGSRSPSSARTNAASTASPQRLTGESSQLLTKKRIQDLVKEIDPNTQLDEDVEEMLLQIADDFIENVVTSGCQLAQHRKSSTLEVKDILLHLERNWNMSCIPGFTMEDTKGTKRPAPTEAHKQRMALIRKALKK